MLAKNGGLRCFSRANGHSVSSFASLFEMMAQQNFFPDIGEGLLAAMALRRLHACFRLWFRRGGDPHSHSGVIK